MLFFIGLICFSTMMEHNSAYAARISQRMRHEWLRQSSTVRVLKGDNMVVEESACNGAINVNVDINTGAQGGFNGSSVNLTFWNVTTLEHGEGESACWTNSNVTNLTQCVNLNNNNNTNTNINNATSPLCLTASQNTSLGSDCALWNITDECLTNHSSGYECPPGLRPSEDPCVEECIRCREPSCPAFEKPANDICLGCVSCVCLPSDSLAVLFTAVSQSRDLNCSNFFGYLGSNLDSNPSYFCQLRDDDPPVPDLNRIVFAALTSHTPYPLTLSTSLIALSESSGSFAITQAVILTHRVPFINVSDSSSPPTSLPTIGLVFFLLSCFYAMID